MNNRNWILVTGGTGFIGFAIVNRLLRFGYKVRVVSRNAHNSRNFGLLAKNACRGQMAVYHTDLSDPRQSKSLFTDVDYVFHAAALVNSTLPYGEFYRSNVLATKNICQLSQKNNIKKLIYISTSDVFGLPENDDIFTEKNPYRYWSEPYPDTKIDATNYVRQYMEKGLNTTIIYPGWVYGPGDTAFIPAILKQLRSGIMPIWDEGKFQISFVYIEDLIDALISSLTVKKSNNDDFIILDDDSRTNLNELCVLLGRIFKVRFRTIPIPYPGIYVLGWISQKIFQLKLTRSCVISTTDVKSFGHPFRFSSSKAKKLLDWKVKTPLEKGLYRWKIWTQMNL